MPGTLSIVATPIGHLEDITLRALRILREADVIAAEDTRHTAKLLHHYDIRTPMTSFHEHNEREKLPVLIRRLLTGERVALVSDAGTPSISDPGYRLVRAAHDAGVKVESIPGPSAPIAALASSGLPTDEFMFLGFPPIRSKARNAWLQRIAQSNVTAIFFESPHRIRATLEDLAELLPPARPIVVARELTKINEELVRGPISAVLTHLSGRQLGEFTVLVSPDQDEPERPGPSANVLADEFCEMTKTCPLSRREMVRALAEKHRLSSRTVYQAIEAAKISGK